MRAAGLPAVVALVIVVLLAAYRFDAVSVLRPAAPAPTDGRTAIVAAPTASEPLTVVP